MPRVTPSQAVALIELMFPKHIAQKAGEKRPLTQDHQPLLAAMLEVIDHIPDELILLDGSDFVEYVSSIAAIRQSVEMWNTNVNWSLIFVRGIRQLSPVTIIRDLLRKCPEEMPAPGTAELGFISAEDTRDALRMDIGAVTQALQTAN